MPTPKPLTSRAFQLPPSTIATPEQISSLLALAVEKPVVFLQGRPAIGKTTLLKQCARQLSNSGMQVHWIQGQPQLSRTVFLECLISQLGLKTPTVEDSQQWDEALEKLFATWEQQKAYVLIDDFDQIEDADRLLELFIQNLFEGRVVVAGRSVPPVSPLLSWDFNVFDYRGLQDHQLKELISKSASVFKAGEIEAVTKELIAQAHGSASYIKNTVGPYLLNRSQLSLSELKRSNSETKKSFLQKLLNSIDAETLNKLFLASLIEYDLSLKRDLLTNLDSSLGVQQLLQFEFLRPNALKSFELSPELSEYLRAQIQEQKLEESLCRELFERVKSRTSIEAMKERLALTGKMPGLLTDSEISQTLDLLLPQIFRKDSMHSIESLTRPFVLQMSRAALEFRRNSLLMLARGPQVIEEYQRVLELPKWSDRERQELKLMLARTIGHSSGYGRGVDLVLEVLRASKDDLHLQAQCHFELLSLHLDRDGNKAAEALESFNRILSKVDEKTRLALTRSTLGGMLNYFNEVGRFGDQSRLIKELEARDDLDLKDQSRITMSRIFDLFERGLADSEYREVEEQIEKERILQNDFHLSILIRLKALHLSFQGRRRRAEGFMNELEKMIRVLSPRPLGLYHYRFLASVAIAFRQFHRLPEIFQGAAHHPSYSCSYHYPAYFDFLKFGYALSLIETSPESFDDLIARIDQHPSLPLDEKVSAARLISQIFVESNRPLPSVKALKNLERRTLLEAENVNFFESILLQVFLVIEELAALSKNSAPLPQALNLKTSDLLSVLKERGLFIWYVRLLTQVAPFHRAEVRATLRAEFLSTLPQIEDEPEVNRLSSVWLNLDGKNSAELEKLATPRTEPLPEVSFSESRTYVQINGVKLAKETKPVLFKLFEILCAKKGDFVSKEELIKNVWQEEYHPLVHDTRLYTNLKRLRRFLEEASYSEKLVNIEGRYALQRPS